MQNTTFVLFAAARLFRQTCRLRIRRIDNRAMSNFLIEIGLYTQQQPTATSMFTFGFVIFKGLTQVKNDKLWFCHHCLTTQRYHENGDSDVRQFSKRASIHRRSQGLQQHHVTGPERVYFRIATVAVWRTCLEAVLTQRH